jgi:16S rRNA (cytosine967-C5)-methyltransferase
LNATASGATAHGATRALVGAVRSVAAVIDQGAAADAALQWAELHPERAAIRAICLGTLRWWLRLEPAIATLIAHPRAQIAPLLRALLVTAAHQLEYSRNRPEAVVFAAVEAARELGLARAAGLTNAVLRRFLRERVSLLAATDRDPAVASAHPRWLHEALGAAWPAERAAVLAANNAHPPLSLRVDRSRLTLAEATATLAAIDIEARSLAWCPSALLLDKPLPVAKLPGFAEGLVSVQDASAQLAALLLGVQPGERVLDACAAPGGKTGALLEAAGGDLQLTAADSDAKRLAQVADNLARLKRSAELVCADLAAAPTWWDGKPYDRILLDAPCSGTGVIRRHPDIKLLRRPEDLAALATAQHALLRGLFALLRPGGQLLYVTCSVLPVENAAVVGRFLAEEPSAASLALPAAEALGPLLRACNIGYQMLPDVQAGGDGFYYASLTRR